MKANADTVIQYLRQNGIGSFEGWIEHDIKHWRESIDTVSSFDLSRISRALGWKNKKQEVITNRKGAGARYYLAAWDKEDWQKLIRTFPNYQKFREHKLFYDVFRRIPRQRKDEILKPLGFEVKATNEDIWRHTTTEELLAYARKHKIKSLKDFPSGAQRYLWTEPGLKAYIEIFRYLEPIVSKIAATKMRSSIEKRKRSAAVKTETSSDMLFKAISELKAKFPIYASGTFSHDHLFRTWVTRFKNMNLDVEFRVLVQLSYGRLSEEARANWLLDRQEILSLVKRMGLTQEHIALFPDLYRLLKGKMIHHLLPGTEKARLENERRLSKYYKDLPVLIKVVE